MYLLSRIVLTLIGLTFCFSSCKYIEYVGEWSGESNTSYASGTPTLGLPQLIILEPQKRSYFANEEISGNFSNPFSDAYSFSPHGGPNSHLQKWNGRSWTKVNTSPRGVLYTQSVRYHSLEWGANIHFIFPAERIESLGNEVSGLYRFTYTICQGDEYQNCKTIYSPEFLVKQRESESRNLY